MFVILNYFQYCFCEALVAVDRGGKWNAGKIEQILAIHFQHLSEYPIYLFRAAIDSMN